MILINDFPNSSDFFRFTLFADDSTLTCSFKNKTQSEISLILETELLKVNNWLNSNKINIDKSNFIHFSFRNHVSFPPLKFGNNFISQINYTKFLGINIDENLRFQEHVKYISSKLSKSLGILFRLNKFFPSNILRNLYYSLIFPYLNYAIEAWYGAPQCVSSRVQVIQKKSIRAIFNLNYNCHTTEYFKFSGILKLGDMYKLNLCTMLFRSLSVSDTFSNNLRLTSNLHNYSTRNSSRNNLIVPRCNTSRTQSSFMYQSISEWNALPDDIRGCETITRFKNKLKKYYLNKY